MLPNYAANFPENLLTKLRLWVNGWDGEFLSYWIFLLHRRFLFFGAFYSPPSDVIRILHFPLNRFYIGFFFDEWNTMLYKYNKRIGVAYRNWMVSGPLPVAAVCPPKDIRGRVKWGNVSDDVVENVQIINDKCKEPSHAALLCVG